MGIGNFFKNLSEKEKIDEFTGLPKHLVEKQERAYFIEKRYRKMKEISDWKEKRRNISIEHPTINGAEYKIPSEFFEKLEEIFTESLLKIHSKKYEIEYVRRPKIVVKFPKSFFFLRLKLRKKSRSKKIKILY